MALRAIKADETHLGPCLSLSFNGAEFRVPLSSTVNFQPLQPAPHPPIDSNSLRSIA